MGSPTALRSCPMPALVDTTIRLLSQEPLAGRVPTGELFRLAEVLDGRGSRRSRCRAAGVFDTAVHRGVGEPLGADPRAESANADAARAGAPRSVPGRLATDRRRLRAPVRRVGGGERHRRVPPARSLERRVQPGGGRRGDRSGGQGVRRGLVYGSGLEREVEALAEQARKLPELGSRARPPPRSRRGRCSRTPPRSSSPGCGRRAGCRSASTVRAPAGTPSRSRSRRRVRAPIRSRARSIRSR